MNIIGMAKLSVYLLYFVPLLLEQLVHAAPLLSNGLQLDGKEGKEEVDLRALMKVDRNSYAIAGSDGDDLLDHDFGGEELQRVKREESTPAKGSTKDGKVSGKTGEPAPSPDDESGDNTMLYVGIGVAVIVVLLLLGCVLYCCCCSGGGKKGKSKSKSKKSKKSRKSSKGSSRSKRR